MTDDEEQPRRSPKLTAKDRAAIEKREQELDDRRVDEDALQRVQTWYERLLGWTHD